MAASLQTVAKEGVDDRKPKQAEPQAKHHDVEHGNLLERLERRNRLPKARSGFARDGDSPVRRMFSRWKEAHPYKNLIKARCPLWVISRHRAAKRVRLLYAMSRHFKRYRGQTLVRVPSTRYIHSHERKLLQ